MLYLAFAKFVHNGLFDIFNFIHQTNGST